MKRAILMFFTIIILFSYCTVSISAVNVFEQTSNSESCPLSVKEYYAEQFSQAVDDYGLLPKNVAVTVKSKIWELNKTYDGVTMKTDKYNIVFDDLEISDMVLKFMEREKDKATKFMITITGETSTMSSTEIVIKNSRLTNMNGLDLDGTKTTSENKAPIGVHITSSTNSTAEITSQDNSSVQASTTSIDQTTIIIIICSTIVVLSIIICVTIAKIKLSRDKNK